MNFDFSWWLLWLTTISGVIWGLDTLLFKAARQRRQAVATAEGAPGAETGADPAPATGGRRDPWLVEYSRSFFPVLGAVLVIRSFIFEPFRIPSDSMMPTLLAGDFIFVSKFSYGLRFPVFNFKVLETGDPQRGDVVVFKLPADPRVNYIKRLIGLPGDHVRVDNDRIYVNGELMPIELGGRYNEHGYVNARLGEENLSGVEHQVMFLDQAFPTDYEGDVPAGQYFFMGDNRDNSQDSRFPQVGFVPEENLVGRATWVWFHWKFSTGSFEWPIFSRMATHIR